MPTTDITRHNFGKSANGNAGPGWTAHGTARHERSCSHRAAPSLPLQLKVNA
jgi:hypothetical protein